MHYYVFRKLSKKPDCFIANCNLLCNKLMLTEIFQILYQSKNENLQLNLFYISSVVSLNILKSTSYFKLNFNNNNKNQPNPLLIYSNKLY